jgi:hypothetical protein
MTWLQNRKHFGIFRIFPEKHFGIFRIFSEKHFGIFGNFVFLQCKSNSKHHGFQAETIPSHASLEAGTPRPDGPSD